MKPTPYFTRWLWVLVAVLLSVMPLASFAKDLDETTASAVHVLRESMRVRSDGEHHKMLTAMRELRDPALKPLFSSLIRSSNPGLMIHGFLGSALCDPKHQMDLARIAAIENPALQAEIISAAMDSDLLTIEQNKQLIGWPGLDEAVKVIVSAPLVQAGGLTDISFLRTAVTSDNLARRSLASMLMLQLGHTEAGEGLEQLNQDSTAKRDAVRRMLLETAIRYEFNRSASWAAAVSTEEGVDSQLGLLALRTAMRFGYPGAVNQWRSRFASTTDIAKRLRLAMVALGLAPWLDPGFFEPLQAIDDPLISRMGHAGAAIAGEKQIDLAMINLIELHHPIANRWALDYAERYASPNDAQVIFLGLVMTFEDYHQRNRREGLRMVVEAVRMMFEADAGSAVSLLKPMLNDKEADTALIQGIFLGLIRCANDDPAQVVKGLAPFSDPKSNHLALLLMAKHGHRLTSRQFKDLELLVRGGGGLTEALRVQVAWAYLKQTDQTRLAVDHVLGG